MSNVALCVAFFIAGLVLEVIIGWLTFSDYSRIMGFGRVTFFHYVSALWKREPGG